MRLNNCWPPLPTLALEKIFEGGGAYGNTMCLFGTHVGKSSHIYVSILVVTTTCALNNPTDQAPWTAFAPVLLVNSSARTTLFSDKLELETIGCGLPEATVHRLLWRFEQVDLDVYSQTCWHVFCVMFCFVLSCPSSLEEAMTWHKKGPVHNIYIYIYHMHTQQKWNAKKYMYDVAHGLIVVLL